MKAGGEGDEFVGSVYIFWFFFVHRFSGMENIEEGDKWFSGLLCKNLWRRRWISSFTAWLLPLGEDEMKLYLW